jgi:hypothetical protein
MLFSDYVEIAENSDNYSWSYITCLFKPFYIVLNNFYIGLGDIFMMDVCSFLLQHRVRFYKFMTISERFDYFFSKSLISWKDEAIRIIHTSRKTFISDISTSLHDDCVSIVPVNLKEIFYYENYKSDDWKHYFLINGVDENSELFHMLDTVHRDAGVYSKYTKFHILSSMLIDSSESYFKSFQSSSKWCFFTIRTNLVATLLKVKNSISLFRNDLISSLKMGIQVLRNHLSEGFQKNSVEISANIFNQIWLYLDLFTKNYNTKMSHEVLDSLDDFKSNLDKTKKRLIKNILTSSNKAHDLLSDVVQKLEYLKI